MTAADTIPDFFTLDEDQVPQADEQEGTRHLVVQRASEIRLRRVTWLWEGRFAAGTLSLLAGREGLGKSTLTAWIVAGVTRGTLPGDTAGAPQAVIIAAAEDSWEHTLVPRLIAAGADLDLVLRVDVETTLGFTTGLSLPRDIPALGDLATRERVGLMVLDPIMSRLDGLDTHKDSEVRRALEPLVRMADETGMAILGLIHVNKSSSDPLNAVMGSKAFTAVARSVSTVVADPEDEDDRRRLFGTVKNNLGPALPASQVFTVETHHIDSDDGTITTGRLEWRGEVDTTIKSAMADPGMESRGALVEASEWLEDYLSMHPGAPRREVFKDGMKVGHSESSLRRAGQRLGVRAESFGFPRQTSWSLSAQPQSAQAVSATHGESVINGLTEHTGSDLQEREQTVSAVGSVSPVGSRSRTSAHTARADRACPACQDPTCEGECTR